MTKLIGNGTNPITPGKMNSRMNRPAPTMAPTALMPSQSATRMLPGLPASARRFSVVWVNDVLATRDIRPDSRLASGRSVRSTRGCWSSSSSRFFACIDPSWVSRACTGSTGELPARPTTISRMAPAATSATTIAMGSIQLDLDVHDAPDEHEAHEHGEAADRQNDHAGREAEQRCARIEHRLHEARCRDEQEPGKRDGQEADNVPREALLRGERLDLALDPDPFPDCVRDRVEDLREVATDRVLDRDGGRHELEV